MKNSQYIKIMHFANLSDLIEMPFLSDIDQLRHLHKDIDIMTLTQAYTCVPKLLLRDCADFVVNISEDLLKSEQIVKGSILFCLRQEHIDNNGDVMIIEIINTGILCRKIYDYDRFYMLKSDNSERKILKNKVRLIAKVTGKFNY